MSRVVLLLSSVIVVVMFIVFILSFSVALVVRHRQLSNIPPKGRIKDVNVPSSTIFVIITVVLVINVLPHQRP
jgi:hypothetical protein